MPVHRGFGGILVTVRFIFVTALVAGQLGSARAALIDRGGGLIYDDLLNVARLQDASLSGTQTGTTEEAPQNWTESRQMSDGCRS